VVNIALTCDNNLLGWPTFCGVYLPAAGGPATAGKPATAGWQKVGSFSLFLIRPKGYGDSHGKLGTGTCEEIDISCDNEATGVVR
jgi:hypothetical protein